MLIFIVLGLLFGVITYFCAGNIIISCFVMIFAILYFLIFTKRRYKKFRIKIERYHSCYRFINSFLISLSIKNACDAAFEGIYENMDQSFKDECEGLENVTGLEKLTYLQKYYRFHIYDLFLNIIALFQEHGGNILQMSSLIIEQSRSLEDYINKTVSLGKRKVIEFSVLWLFAIIILVALRFVLGQFYNSIISQIAFQVAIGSIFVFITISIDILISRICKLDIRGWNNEEF